MIRHVCLPALYLVDHDTVAVAELALLLKHAPSLRSAKLFQRLSEDCSETREALTACQSAWEHDPQCYPKLQELLLENQEEAGTA